MTLNDVLLVQIAGVLQLCILVASAIVPFQMDWKRELGTLPKLHRQLYLIYGGYVVLGITWLGITTLSCAEYLVEPTPVARAFCIYATLFWGIRLSLQTILDAKPFLTRWWLTAGYHLLTVLFASFTFLFGWLTIRSFL
ncbi:MAG: hypothetical protein KDA88_16195 [Planctomycetaceae bacterium]|nr:hypothetical protein [Planctomycetaceae bacterium]MCB9952206.1 hypothetical protein [Planctomycetaceae bacterium]